MDRRRGLRALALLTAAGVGAGLALAFCRGWTRRPRATMPAPRAGIPQPIGTPEMGAMPELEGG